MNLKWLLTILCLLLALSVVSASDNAPPAMPSEYWGNVTVDGALVSGGLSVVGYVKSISYGFMDSGTANGYYDIILTGGDRPLTYNNDRDCSTHYSAGEACVPCNDESDCIEGPQDDDAILINVDGSATIPSLGWLSGSNDNIPISVQQYKLALKDSEGTIVAWFSTLGNLWLKGALEQSSAYTATGSDEFRFQDRDGNDIAIIDATSGNMYIDGALFQNQTSLTPADNSYDFIIKNEGSVVAYINELGNLFLKGKITENGSP